MLSDGAAAMMSGDWERGVQLTQMGLSSALSQTDRAAAYANLCAGYAALKKYQRALENCDQSSGDLRRQLAGVAEPRRGPPRSRTRSRSRCATFERGLQLNPDSQDLQKTLAIARGYEKLQQERMRHLLES